MLTNKQKCDLFKWGKKHYYNNGVVVSVNPNDFTLNEIRQILGIAIPKSKSEESTLYSLITESFEYLKEQKWNIISKVDGE